MTYFSILISNSEISGPGGLFDFDATLPLVAIQFLLLMVLLNILLYNPLLNVIEERKEYILTNLSKASDMLTESNKLTTQCEEALTTVRKRTQLEIANAQKICKETVEIELNISQRYIDNLFNTLEVDLNQERNIADVEESTNVIADYIENILIEMSELNDDN